MVLRDAISVTRYLKALLLGIKAHDPLTISLASLLLLGVTALAGFLPALRATRVQPMAALRHD